MAQETKKENKQSRRDERRQKTNALVKQEEEGVLSYSKQNTFGLELRTNGYGLFFEHGRMRSPRFTNLYSLELSEIMHPKEEKLSNNSQGYFANSFKYGKIINFYQAKLGFGQQYIFGQKGNKNGIAVMGIVKGGLAIGLMKPYYLNVEDGTGTERTIKYSRKDSSDFVGARIIGSAGLGKGWSEVKVNPGLFINTALRFDFGAFNESISALELGFSADAYSKKVEQLVANPSKRFFYQAHVALLFGNRK